jgi:hypothetical protein
VKGRIVKSSGIFSCCGSVWRWLGAAAILAGILALNGCNKGGARGYNVSGTVTYKGQPIPVGSIVFEPDAGKGNSGPSGSAQIKDGKYDTSLPGGKGTVGGPHLVRIIGLDGKPAGELTEGTPLFPDYRTTIDLPKETSTQNFDVPEGGGSSAPKSKGPDYSDV